MPEELIVRGQIDYRKLKLWCSDIKRPLLERLEVFDIAFNTNEYAVVYKKLPWVLKEYLVIVDERDGFKAMRNLLSSWAIYTKR